MNTLDDLKNTLTEHTDKPLIDSTPTSLEAYLQAATSDNTRRAYRSAIRQFEKWGGRLPCDREQVIRYLLARAPELNPRSLDLHLTAISQWHYYQQWPDPVKDPKVAKIMEGIRRLHAKPKAKARALRLEHLVQMMEHLQKSPSSLKQIRDRALILVGFLGALRRSELVTIQVEDLIWEQEGLLIHLNRSKTDQTGKGLLRAIPYADHQLCAARAMRDWLQASSIRQGYVFRPINRWGQLQLNGLNPAAVNEVLKRLGESCDFDFIPELSSHSLRRGLSTSAAREGIAFDLIKKQGGWQSDATVRGYIQEGELFTHNAAGELLKRYVENKK